MTVDHAALNRIPDAVIDAAHIAYCDAARDVADFHGRVTMDAHRQGLRAALASAQTHAISPSDAEMLAALDALPWPKVAARMRELIVQADRQSLPVVELARQLIEARQQLADAQAEVKRVRAALAKARKAAA